MSHVEDCGVCDWKDVGKEMYCLVLFLGILPYMMCSCIFLTLLFFNSIVIAFGGKYFL